MSLSTTTKDNTERCLGFIRRLMASMPPEVCESRRFYIALTAMKRMLELHAPVPERLLYVQDEGVANQYAQEWTEQSEPAVEGAT